MLLSTNKSNANKLLNEGKVDAELIIPQNLFRCDGDYDIIMLKP